MDRRRFVRFDVNLEVRYRVLESLKPYQSTSSEEMCERGLRIILPEYFEPGTRLELTIRIHGEPHPIVAIGKVSWVKKGILRDFYTTGIDLVHIKEEDKDKFYKYVLLKKEY